MQVELETSIDNRLNNPTISHIKAKAVEQGNIAIFIFKSLTLEGKAIKV